MSATLAMSSILAVDWGTSSFRLMHIGPGGELLGILNADKGVSRLTPAEMEPFLQQQITTMGPDVSGLPVILCGMVGSAIGWREAPYVDCPVDPARLASNLLRVPSERLQASIVPGLRTQSELGQPDVMRGEETQVVGWLAGASAAQKASAVLCLPGTHSKWVRIENGEVRNFNTALTGELYAVLQQHSILARGEQQEDPAAFAAGLAASAASPSLLHLLFSTRSRMLAGLHPASACASYLSGLLIGAEIGAALAQTQTLEEVHLIGGKGLLQRYEAALAHYQLRAISHEGDACSARGLWQLYRASQAA
ncbi:MAG: 2-dehydro-3-deoxygalactonokinase [Gammaproteobacteria bacterium]|nr:2-dehydro-3-deoxygalactonokinase [Gammaproteobacteria bacterium]